jgi:hypothetical protein
MTFIRFDFEDRPTPSWLENNVENEKKKTKQARAL